MARRYQHHWYLNEEGEAQPWPDDDLLGWAEWLEKADRKICRDYSFGDDGGIVVSTVFLGLNHSFDEGPPVLFETMVFGGEHHELQARYHTREEAEQGHEDIVKMLQSYYATGKPKKQKNGNDHERDR